jgi:hypothetical protein
MNPYTSDGVLIVMVGAYFAESAQPHRQLFALTDPGLEARILSTKNGQSDSEGGGNVDTRARQLENGAECARSDLSQVTVLLGLVD